MKSNFEFKHSIRGVDFQYACGPIVGEREIHPYHEILYYIDGDATLLTEGFDKKPRQGTVILIPRESYHFFKCDESDKFRRLKISFTEIVGFEQLSDEIMSGIRFFENLDSDVIALLDKTCEKMQRGDGSAFSFGALLILLSSLDGDARHTSQHTRSKSISAALEYIDAHLTECIDVKTIAANTGVSSSTLSHTFKREMGISLHQYVTQKRMILARRLIDGGQLPTKIFSDCGFSDYSSFYKAYVAYFGHSPSKIGHT